MNDAQILPAQQQHRLGTAYPQIDAFYDWVYARGLARLATKGITPQKLYTMLHQEGRR